MIESLSVKDELIDLLGRALEMLEGLEGNEEALDKAYDMILQSTDIIEKYAVE